MNEDFLQYLWRFQKFDSRDLLTVCGQPVQVLRVGVHNSNAGPDFLNARVRIGKTEWAGNVEVHIQASDWLRHHHQLDPAYDNVVLHVVYSADAAIKNGANQDIPTLSLKDRFDYQAWRYYKAWLKHDSFIPCESMAGNVPDIVKAATVSTAAVDRLTEKASDCALHLGRTQGDIEETLYCTLMRAFGLKVNAMPFEQLALNAPYHLIRRVGSEPLSMEALLLGQAGFLNDIISGEPYVGSLQEAYKHLQVKFDLKPMPKSAWKLFRLRPSNFPQIRIAQVAALYAREGALAQKVLESSGLKDLTELLEVTLTHDFWRNHYTLDKKSPASTKRLGEAALHILMINAIVPFLFALGNYNQNESIRERAIDLLEAIPGEKNQVIHRFMGLGFRAPSSLESQGLLHLKKYFCDAKKCLTCKTGIYLLDNYKMRHG